MRASGLAVERLTKYACDRYPKTCLEPGCTKELLYRSALKAHCPHCSDDSFSVGSMEYTLHLRFTVRTADR